MWQKASILLWVVALNLHRLLVHAGSSEREDASPPHIVWVVADDLGWNDVQFTKTNACDVLSPTLSRLALEGVVLDNYYVSPICTPTRNCFMTGRYPIHTGLQHGVIRDAVPNGLPLNETTIASVLKKLGYSTHMIGKWHLGFYHRDYTPQKRGFDSYFGYYTGNEEFWNHTSLCWSCGNYTALDLHRATPSFEEVVRDKTGIYSTNLFTDEAISIIKEHNPDTPLFLYLPFEAVHGAASCDPNCEHPYGDLLQAPDYYIDQQKQISNMQRRVYGGMVGALDDAVNNITQHLKTAGLWNNTVLLFTTDNGAPAGHFDGHAMNNWPLRGGKGTLWEGGVRGAAFITAPGRLSSSVIGTSIQPLLHATDWFPTFVRLGTAGNATLLRNILGKLPLDGFDVWDSISKGNTSPRTEILHNIDPIANSAAVRVGNWKLLVGQGSATWWPPYNLTSTQSLDGEVFHWPQAEDIQRASDEGQLAAQKNKTYLFNINEDPYERNDLSASQPEKVAELMKRLDYYRTSSVPCRYPDPDPNANPNLPGRTGVWQPWMD